MNPTIIAPVRRRNPDWRRGGPEEYYIEIPTEVEIVQLNLNSGGMRVRWPEADDSKKGFTMQSCDISIEHFYKVYDIVKK